MVGSYSYLTSANLLAKHKSGRYVLPTPSNDCLAATTGREADAEQRPMGALSMSRTLVVRYRTTPETADENARLVADVYAALAAVAPADFRYATYRLGDAVSFVHVATYVPTLIFFSLNLGSGLSLMLTGTVLNLIPIIANGGHLPVDPRAWNSAFFLFHASA